MKILDTQVLDAAPSFDLTTLANVKMEYDIQDESHDVFFRRLITRVSDEIAGYCSRVFALQTYADTFIGEPRDWNQRRHTIFLSNRPVVPGTVVVVHDGNVLTEGVDYLVTTGAGMLRHLHGWFWPHQNSQVLVTYDAGWILPGWPISSGSGSGQAAKLPSAVEHAAILHFLAKREAGRMSYSSRDPFLRSETIDGAGTLSYGLSSRAAADIAGVGGMTLAVQSALAPYVIPVLGGGF
jgi:hypothetical protein